MINLSEIFVCGCVWLCGPNRNIAMDCSLVSRVCCLHLIFHPYPPSLPPSPKHISDSKRCISAAWRDLGQTECWLCHHKDIGLETDCWAGLVGLRSEDKIDPSLSEK